jgi:preprotein translocase subunit SecG
VKTFLVKALLVCLFLSTSLLFSQAAPEGISEGYDGGGGMCRSN